MREGKSPVFESKFLKRLNKKQKFGAVVSAIIALLCMYGLYNMEFTVDVTNTDSFEVAIDEYFFDDNIDVNIVQSDKVGKNLFVLFEREGYKGHYGIASLESGLFGKYRFTNASLSDWPLYNYTFNRDKRYLMLYGINDLPRVQTYAVYPSDDTSKEPIYQGETENVPFLRVVKLDSPEDYVGVQFVHYYDANGDEIEFNQLWDEAPQPDEGRTSSVGSAELGMVYVFIGIVFVLGIIFVRYFITP